jgi:SAM-dependent methyltransferase
MPGVAENRRKWSEHNWEHGGHRWSPGGTPHGTEMMWGRSIRPRIARFLPAGTVLEIAPGYGRWTTYLLGECHHLIGVDITERCIDVCRERFPDPAQAQFFVNDGASLAMIRDRSIDFAFSFDSLVHVEAVQIRAYLQELARTLRPGAAAFLHHSNLGAYVDRRSGAVPPFVLERHWRAPTVSARELRALSREAGLRCVSHELINWIGRDTEVDRYRLPGTQLPLTDCLTTLVREPVDGRSRVYVNRSFVDEWRQLIELARVYAPPPEAGATEPATAAWIESPPEPPRVTPWRRRLGWLRHRLAGWRFALQEPVVRALRRRRCPDCGSKVDGGLTLTCRRCGLDFVVR